MYSYGLNSNGLYRYGLYAYGLYSYIVMAYIVMADIVMACTGMAYIFVACTVWLAVRSLQGGSSRHTELHVMISMLPSHDTCHYGRGRGAASSPQHHQGDGPASSLGRASMGKEQCAVVFSLAIS